MEVLLKPEYELSTNEIKQIEELRASCFPEIEITNHYGKQLPTARIIVSDDGQMTGHIGLVLRMILVNEKEIRIMGIQDVVVEPKYRGQGIMSRMIEEAEKLAIKSNCRMMMLFASEPEIYHHLGFDRCAVDMEWLKIHDGRNLGIGQEKVEETMIKRMDGFNVDIRSIDMLGHIF